MRTLTSRWLAITTAMFGAGVVLSQAPTPEEKTYAKMPWHLIDTWWDLGQETPFESLSVDVTISDDVSPNVNLYIAPIGLGHLGKTPFYGGIQTRADGYTKREPRLRVIGPGFLFSMWGERRLEAIRPADGGWCQSSGHEGDFISVRRPMAWKKGQYTYRLCKMDQENVDGKPCTWVGAFVHAKASDENFFVGALRFPGEKQALSRKLANFIEIYGARKPVSEIPKVTVTFGPPRVNGQAVKPVSVEAVYPKNVPDYADAKMKEGAIEIAVGQAVPQRETRRVKLASSGS